MWRTTEIRWTFLLNMLLWQNNFRKWGLHSGVSAKTFLTSAMYSFSLGFSSEKKLTLAVFHSNRFSPNSNQNLNIRLADSEFRLICSGQRMVKSRIYQGPYLICQANHIYRYTLGDQSLLILGSDCEISNGLCSGGKLFRTLIFFLVYQSWCSSACMSKLDI